MTDRPILFSGPMVRALLDGRKTQTRRMLKPQPDDILEGQIPRQLRTAIGDRLWVKETWRPHGWHSDCVEIAYAAQRGLVGWSEQHAQIRYPDGDRNGFKYYAPEGPDFWRPSLFMPRWASRLTLIVTDVRVERLQNISGDDAIAEGAEIDPNYRTPCLDGVVYPMVKVAPGAWMSPVAWYHRLWDQINGPKAWEANPWVAVYTFTVIKQNIDQIEKVAA
ncbi:hypothetical protein CN217_26565 [Sinorhizobium meliloti]|uniref:hypothetical protein n=1 Tax=Rhizobium meliloti TaxID=382 RepID=UPI000FD1E306|nr:hypothetical protein [Sinorhizobium meliloti]RVH05067.1 hypothetical protein CN217_26565 [Sinorhizobium meliloti]